MKLCHSILVIPITSIHSYSHVTRRLSTTIGSSTSMPDSAPEYCSNYFLLKSEPNEFSIQDLQQKPGSVEEWTGVRNYEARNILRTMQMGDRAFFYHSSCAKPAIVGTVTISRTAIPDVTASTIVSSPDQHPDPKSTTNENSPWVSVQVRLESIFPHPILLKELRQLAKSNSVIAGMSLLRKSRLSVSRVTHDEWLTIEQLVERKVSGDGILQNHDMKREEEESSI